MAMLGRTMHLPMGCSRLTSAGSSQQLAQLVLQLAYLTPSNRTVHHRQRRSSDPTFEIRT